VPHGTKQKIIQRKNYKITKAYTIGAVSFIFQATEATALTNYLWFQTALWPTT